MEVDGEDGEDEELPGKIRNDPAIRKKISPISTYQTDK